MQQIEQMEQQTLCVGVEAIKRWKVIADFLEATRT